jgi:molecular chaperone DnaK
VNPIVVHVVRPYASEQEYLNAEAWSIEPRGMLLIDAEDLPADTAVLFDVSLADGQKPIRAEGRVIAAAPARDGRPAGLKVRFKRFGAATKAFIERAVKLKNAAGEPERPSQPEAERPSAPEAEPASAQVERVSLPELRASMTDLEQLAGAPAPRSFDAPAPPSDSAVRQRVPGPVSAPMNREELLARLRQRRQTG